jgi:hypothetical protein
LPDQVRTSAEAANGLRGSRVQRVVRADKLLAVKHHELPAVVLLQLTAMSFICPEFYF